MQLAASQDSSAAEMVLALQGELAQQAYQADYELQEVTALLKESEATIHQLECELAVQDEAASDWQGQAQLLYDQSHDHDKVVERLQGRIHELHLRVLLADDRAGAAMLPEGVAKAAIEHLAKQIEASEGWAKEEENARFSIEERLIQVEDNREREDKAALSHEGVDHEDEDLQLRAVVLATRVQNMEEQLIQARDEAVVLMDQVEADQALLVEELRIGEQHQLGSPEWEGPAANSLNLGSVLRGLDIGDVDDPEDLSFHTPELEHSKPLDWHTGERAGGPTCMFGDLQLPEPMHSQFQIDVNHTRQQ